MWKALREGDIVEIIAPSSGMSLNRLEMAKRCLRDWGLVPRVSPDFFGNDPLYANSFEYRLKDFTRSLTAADSRAIWCLRGGTGATQLIPALSLMRAPREKSLLPFIELATSYAKIVAQLCHRSVCFYCRQCHFKLKPCAMGLFFH